MKHLSHEDFKSFEDRQVAGYNSSLQSSGLVSVEPLYDDEPTTQ